MNLLILKGFNNYFNRKIKKYSDLQDYIDNSSDSYNFTNINFNPNDGVATSQVIGSENQQQTGGSDPVPLMWEQNGSPDYLVAYTTETIDEQTITTIHSRWFVLESVRTRNGQYQLALKRDIIADHLEAILTNPCFVEKGYVQPNNPLIFNEENVSLNQIKNYKGEHPEEPLKDKTGIPWIVIYLAQNAPKDNAQPVYGKQILDTQDAIDYDELPWAGIESGANMSNTTQIRRIPGAGEINISPIICNYLDSTGFGKYILSPARANMRYGYNSTLNNWKLDNNTSNSQNIGKDTHLSDSPFSWYYGNILLREQINLTPATNSVRWNNTGNQVSSFWAYDNNVDHQVALTPKNVEHGKWLLAHGGLSNENTLSHRNTILNYLNGKRTWLESSTGHSTVPGQPNMEAWVGGPQAFKPASDLLYYNNKLVTYDNINYYRIKITRQNNYTRPIDYFVDSDGTITGSSVNNLASALTRDGKVESTTTEKPVNSNNTMVETFFEHAWFDIQYEKVTADLITCSIQPQGSSDRLQLNDCAYDMICLPYGAIDFKVTKGASIISKTSTKEASIGIARAIAAALGSSIYDMQLLPYCPWQAAVTDYVTNGYVNITGTISPGSQTLATGCWFGVYKINSEGDTPDRENTVTFGLWCPQSHGSFDIDYQIEVPEEDSIEYKLFNACKKFRLVAPNYSSIFEFNPLKNGGVTQFNVDYNYRPFNPYIHISPIFDGLYGVDQNDNRGLILQGDFSIGYYSDKWAEYQIQNANYANIFDRQIQNIDVAQGMEREKQTWNNWATGITEGLGLGGGMQGAKAFSGLGPWGMLGGGIGGTVGGIVGAAVGLPKDWEWLTRAQQEEKSYAIDMYNLQLGNVKALPYGLAKSDAQTENFKYFPFIEEYDCTEIEKEMFRNKLKYDGMTVMSVATIAEYLPEGTDYEFQKVKGRMIMLDNITDDFQIANDIYTEVNKGFYYIPVESEGE